MDPLRHDGEDDFAARERLRRRGLGTRCSDPAIGCD